MQQNNWEEELCTSAWCQAFHTQQTINYFWKISMTVDEEASRKITFGRFHWTLLHEVLVLNHNNRNWGSQQENYIGGDLLNYFQGMPFKHQLSASAIGKVESNDNPQNRMHLFNKWDGYCTKMRKKVQGTFQLENRINKESKQITNLPITFNGIFTSANITQRRINSICNQDFRWTTQPFISHRDSLGFVFRRNSSIKIEKHKWTPDSHFQWNESHLLPFT